MKAMAEKYLIHICVIVFLSLTPMDVSAQTTQEVEARRKAALEDVELTSRLLNEVRVSTRISLNSLNLLFEQIQTRKEALELLRQEISSIDRDLVAMNKELAALETDLKTKRNLYARSVQNMYTRNASQYKWLFVLSANNFTQIVRRMRYIREYADWQKHQAVLIIQKQDEIDRKQSEIERSRAEKSVLLSAGEEERRQLEKEEAEQKALIQQLNRRQSDLQNELNQKKRLADALNRQIEQVITKETTTNSSTPPSPPDERLSNDFAANRGRLPAPVSERYRIVVPFGEYQHPLQRNVRMNSNGIEMQTTSGAEALAVFNGEVTSIFVYNNTQCVIIRHGSYLTLYANLSEVYVSNKQKVSTSQRLGKIFTDTKKDNATILHFEIRKDREKLNPVLWLRR